MEVKRNVANDWKAKNIFLSHNHVENLYQDWAHPNVIISDGAYGVSGFKGDTVSHEGLPAWYEPHLQAWSKKAQAGTTLWFWNTEIGFAKVHPLLEKYDWEYVSCNIWNKGIQHIAGNCNLKVLKSYPVVTEVCVQYVKKATFIIDGNEATLKDWLRHEWNRAGLTLQQANEACQIANAASRKYLTKDHLWYAPPPEHFENLSNFANQHGTIKGLPYFSTDGQKPMNKVTYAKLFATFNGKYGITNVWDTPPLHTKERVKIVGGNKYFHLNQKPLKLMELIISSSSLEDDVIWEPFGGLFSASLAGALPNYFKSEILIKGINVTDIYAVGSLFSAVIEAQIVDMLNKLRSVWDAENQYSNYVFIRQSQTFPDILFANIQNNNHVIFGIELKASLSAKQNGSIG